MKGSYSTVRSGFCWELRTKMRVWDLGVGGWGLKDEVVAVANAEEVYSQSIGHLLAWLL